VVLVEVLVLKGHVAVVHRDGQLALAKQPLLGQVVVNFVPGLHKMVRLTITIKILSIVNTSQSRAKPQHILDALARIPRPLPSNKLSHERGRVPHHQAGQVSTTNTVLAQSQQCHGVQLAHTHTAPHASHASHASQGHGHHHRVHRISA